MSIPRSSSSVRRGGFFVLFALLSKFLLNCSSSPFEPVIVHGVTAEFENLEVSLALYNTSWYPRDAGPLPPRDTVLMTFLIHAANNSSVSRLVGPSDFRLRTLEGTPHEGPLWNPVSVGRNPPLQAVRLAPGETTQGWLTYSVPLGSLVDELIWAPRPRVAFAIQLPPPSDSFSRIAYAVVFGQVRDSQGSPLANALLEVNIVEVPGVPGSISTIGDCSGTLINTQESVTNQEGWYEDTLSSTAQLCIDVRLASPPANARSSGRVVPSAPHPVAELPEVRIEIVVPPGPLSSYGANSRRAMTLRS
jgi:hypothetical protein